MALYSIELVPVYFIAKGVRVRTVSSSLQNLRIQDQVCYWPHIPTGGADFIIDEPGQTGVRRDNQSPPKFGSPLVTSMAPGGASIDMDTKPMELGK